MPQLAGQVNLQDDLRAQMALSSNIGSNIGGAFGLRAKYKAQKIEQDKLKQEEELSKIRRGKLVGKVASWDGKDSGAFLDSLLQIDREAQDELTQMILAHRLQTMTAPPKEPSYRYMETDKGIVAFDEANPQGIETGYGAPVDKPDKPSPKQFKTAGNRSYIFDPDSGKYTDAGITTQPNQFPKPPDGFTPTEMKIDEQGRPSYIFKPNTNQRKRTAEEIIAHAKEIGMKPSISYDENGEIDNVNYTVMAEEKDDTQKGNSAEIRRWQSILKGYYRPVYDELGFKTGEEPIPGNEKNIEIAQEQINRLSSAETASQPDAGGPTAEIETTETDYETINGVPYPGPISPEAIKAGPGSPEFMREMESIPRKDRIPSPKVIKAFIAKAAETWPGNPEEKAAVWAEQAKKIAKLHGWIVD